MYVELDEKQLELWREEINAVEDIWENDKFIPVSEMDEHELDGFEELEEEAPLDLFWLSSYDPYIIYDGSWLTETMLEEIKRKLFLESSQTMDTVYYAVPYDMDIVVFFSKKPIPVPKEQVHGMTAYGNALAIDIPKIGTYFLLSGND